MGSIILPRLIPSIKFLSPIFCDLIPRILLRSLISTNISGNLYVTCRVYHHLQPIVLKYDYQIMKHLAQSLASSNSSSSPVLVYRSYPTPNFGRPMQYFFKCVNSDKTAFFIVCWWLQPFVILLDKKHSKECR